MATLTSSIHAVSDPIAAGRSVLVYTHCGSVETGILLDRSTLDKLAAWLCDNNCCVDVEQYMTDKGGARYERERKENGGYCHHCRDFAGKLLASFNVTERGGAQ